MSQGTDGLVMFQLMEGVGPLIFKNQSQRALIIEQPTMLFKLVFGGLCSPSAFLVLNKSERKLDV